MARSLWSGSISFGLVNVPVRLYSAVQPKTVHFHMIRNTDASRISYRKVSASDGKEVPEEQIVKGYEVSPDKYVKLEKKELDALDPEHTRAIAIEKFVPLVEIDHIYFEKAYYLGPEKASKRAYALLLDAMKETNKVAIARIVFHNKEHLVALRPLDNAIVMFTLYYPDEVVPRDDLENIPDKADHPSGKELEVAKQLVDAISGEFEPKEYHDQYRQRVLELIEKKAAGKTIESAPVKREKPSNVVNLMEALQASLAASKKTRLADHADKTRRRKKSA